MNGKLVTYTELLNCWGRGVGTLLFSCFLGFWMKQRIVGGFSLSYGKIMRTTGLLNWHMYTVISYHFVAYHLCSLCSQIYLCIGLEREQEWACWVLPSVSIHPNVDMACIQIQVICTLALWEWWVVHIFESFHTGDAGIALYCGFLCVLVLYTDMSSARISFH